MGPRLLYSILTSYFKALGMPRPAMYNDVLCACLHVFVNWFLVFGGPFRSLLGWEGLGFIGAGLAISVTRTLEATFYAIYMLQRCSTASSSRVMLLEWSSFPTAPRTMRFGQLRR